jgi:hydroxyacylglutathione hydrolase
VIRNGLNILYCLNTHCHIDHIIGNAYIKGRYNCKLVMPKEDIFLLTIMEEEASRYGMQTEYSPLPDILFEDLIEVKLGDLTGKFIFTPGHSPGEFCIYFEEDKILLTGDVLFKGNIGRTDLWNGNYEALVNSIRTKLYNLPDDIVVYPGHDSSTTIGREKKNNQYVTV